MYVCMYVCDVYQQGARQKGSHVTKNDPQISNHVVAQLKNIAGRFNTEYTRTHKEKKSISRM